MEPGSRKEWSNQGENSNVQIRILVFFASTLYLRCTPTNVLIMPLFLLETFNGSLGHFVTSALLSLLHRAFYTVAHTTFTIIFPLLFLTEKSRPALRNALSVTLSTFFPLPQHASLFHTCFSCPQTKALLLWWLSWHFASRFLFALTRVFPELEVFLYVFVPFSRLSSWRTVSAISFLCIVSL